MQTPSHGKFWTPQRQQSTPAGYMRVIRSTLELIYAADRSAQLASVVYPPILQNLNVLTLESPQVDGLSRQLLRKLIGTEQLSTPRECGVYF